MINPESCLLNLVHAHVSLEPSYASLHVEPGSACPQRGMLVLQGVPDNMDIENPAAEPCFSQRLAAGYSTGYERQVCNFVSWSSSGLPSAGLPFCCRFVKRFGMDLEGNDLGECHLQQATDPLHGLPLLVFWQQAPEVTACKLDT